MRTHAGILVLALALGATLSFPFGASAAEKTTSLDQETLRRGFTVTSEDTIFRIGIPPGAFSAPVRVTISDESTAELQPPAGSSFVTPQYTFVTESGQQSTRLPFRVTFALPAEPFVKRTIAYLNDEQHAWQELPTKVGFSTLSASSSWASAHVVVLEQKVDLSATPWSSKSLVALESTSGTVLASYNETRLQPIASLTKLMTALVGLELKPQWNRLIRYSRQDNRPGGALSVLPGEQMRIKDAFAAMLIGSANNATETFVRSTGLSEKQFVRRMNQKAKDLGLLSTHFSDATGLSAKNISTAYEYALIARAAFAQKEILALTSRKKYTFVTRNTQKKHTIKNTNLLLQNSTVVRAGKTGFTDEAGYCLVLNAVDSLRRTEILVLLGTATSQARFLEAEALLRLMYAAPLPRSLDG
ncbi:MAG: serine hydrolase [bacterium]